MSTDKLWTAISGIERQLNNLKGELINIDEETTQSAEAYQRGLTDAWECAKKIAQKWEEDTDTEHRLVIDDSISVTLDSMTASEAIEKLKAYEEQKADDEIKLGDEVEHTSRGRTSKAIFLENVKYYDEDWYRCLFYIDCEVRMLVYPKNQFKRTGRHFDIDKILEAMKE